MRTLARCLWLCVPLSISVTLARAQGAGTFSSLAVGAWTNRFNGTANSDDRPAAAAVDHLGNVFVTGDTTENGTDWDYATVAYSRTGVPLWTNRYASPGTNWDRATAIAVDQTGNVFVTGGSYSGYTSECVTIGYSGAGAPLWTNHYKGPNFGLYAGTAIAVDDSGNVIITGSPGGAGAANCMTIAYSNSGVPLWTNIYNQPANRDDIAVAMAVAGGKVFITGYSLEQDFFGYDNNWVTIAYSTAGTPLWTNRYDGPSSGDNDMPSGIAVDTNGRVFVTGGEAQVEGSRGDYLTIAYSPAGVPLWTNRYNGTGNGWDTAEAVAVDRSGRVFVAGISFGLPGHAGDYVTVAYADNGVPLWTNRYDGGSQDHATGLVVDGNGNVIVTGYSQSFSNGFDVLTISYSGVGVPMWTNRYAGPRPGGNDMPRGRRPLAIAPDGVVVTALSDSGNGFDDFATIKYLFLPQIAISSLNGRVVLSWPSTAPPFTLQKNLNLGSVAWNNVMEPASDDGVTTTVTVPASAGNHFFRLQR